MFNAFNEFIKGMIEIADERRRQAEIRRRPKYGYDPDALRYPKYPKYDKLESVGRNSVLCI